MMEELFSWVLERKDYEKLQLNDYFYSRPEIIVPVKTIMKDLDWSRYRVLSTYELLSNDIKQLEPTAKYAFNYDDELKAVVVDHDVRLDRQMLQRRYLDASIVWQYLGEVVDESIASLENFAQRHLTSIPVVRAAKQIVDEHLAQLNLRISKDNRVIGSETTIRSFYFGIVRSVKGLLMISATSDRFDQQVDQIFQKITQKLNGRMRQTNILKLKLTISIWFLRIRKNNFATAEDVTYVFDDKNPIDKDGFHQAILDVVAELIENENMRKVEARFLTAAIYATGVVPGNHARVFDEETQQVLKGMNDSLKQSYQEFFKVALTTTQAGELDDMLFATHLSVLFFPYARFVARKNHRIKVDSLPVQSIFAEFAMQRIISDHGLPIKVAEAGLFNDYLVNFTYLISTELLPVVNVVFDFADNHGMAKLLYQRIGNIQGVNINICDYLSDQTDIYVSDQILTWDQEVPAFLWNELPSDYAFSQFLKRVVEITRDQL